MPLIACLHTADSNIAVFDGALSGGALAGLPGRDGVRLRHLVLPDLLRDAAAAGGLTPGIAGRTQDALRALGRDADAVLLTCSTLGPAIEGIAAPVPVLRADAALAAEAVLGGGTVQVLCATATTLDPTRRLFDAAALATGARVQVLLVPGAWDLFLAGDQAGYWRLVAEAADAAAQECIHETSREAAQAGTRVRVRVALAQASMAGAAELARCRPLTSPVSGLRATVQAASGLARRPAPVSPGIQA